MRHRVQNILLVSSLYDYFILAEDGQLHKALLSEYSQLNLSNQPSITWVASGSEALELARKEWRFDLVITSMHVGDMDALDLTRRLKEHSPQIPVVLLAYNNRELTAFRAKKDVSLLDKIFLWQGDVRILLAIVKFVEDRLNVAYDTGVAGVPVIIVVEDNVRYYSSFLPVIYREMVFHTRQVLSEALNVSQKLLRMRARPKVLLCETYEEAWAYFSKFTAHVIGVISDIEFPWKGAVHPQAGTELARHIRKERYDVPIMLQSSMARNRGLADSIDAIFLLKGSPDLMHRLRRVIVEHLGFGDFLFETPERKQVGRASDLSELIECIRTVPPESLVWHADQNHFSSWLKARAELELSEEIRPLNVSQFANPEELREGLIRTISDYRRRRDRVVVADFDRQHHRLDINVARIGGGSLGGKARGLAFANRLLSDYDVASAFPEVDVSVPKAVVLGTDIFDQFLDQGELRNFALNAESDEEVHRRFSEAPFPQEGRRDLMAFLEEAPFPLAVRSSGLLEDSPHQPFAGVYETFMLPNDHRNLAQRLESLVTGIKKVWASTFSRQAKTFLKMTPYHLEEEKMGVIVQRIVGQAHGDRYYPSFAGVARSHDFYPIAPQKSEDGVVAVALGLGKTVTDGGDCVRFSPRYPQKVISLSQVQDVLENTQRSFFALDVGTPSDGFRAADLSEHDLHVAEKDGVLGPIGSTYDHQSRVVHDGTARPGMRLVTFAGVLKHDVFPLARLLERLLEISSDACAGPVEIEFAVNMPATPGLRPEFGFLQLRPLALFGEQEEIGVGDVDPNRIVCSSGRILGNGRFADISDIVWVDPRNFDRARTREVAADVARMNDTLQKEGRSFILLGVGRWGSADPFLGIPVTWAQISGARVIVEAGFEDMTVEPSQGSHFFQNLTSCEVGYLSVHPSIPESTVDWDWLREQPTRTGTPLVRHIRLEKPLDVRMDGHRGYGVVLRPK